MKNIKIFIYIIKIKFINKLIDLGLRHDNAFVVALAFGLLAKKVGKRQNIKVIALGRSIFNDDIQALAKYGGRIQYIIIPLPYFQMIFDHFTDPEERKKLTESNYHNVDYCLDGRKKCFVFLLKVLPLMQKLFGFKAVLTGAFGYVAQQELARTCDYYGIPFIVLHKEGLAITGTHKSWMESLNFFNFRNINKILVYNNEIRDTLFELDNKDIYKDKLSVPGVPRLDNYFTIKGKGDIKQVVLFSFFGDDKFYYLLDGDESRIKLAKKRCDDFHIWTMRFAQKNPSYKVFIKTKSSVHYFEYVKELYKQEFKTNISNLIITNSINPYDLIKESQTVIGYYSTTLVEALAASRFLVSPYFGDIIKNKQWDHFGKKYLELINYANSEKKLASLIINGVQEEINLNIKNNFLSNMVSRNNFGASKKAEEVIIETIKQNCNLINNL